MFWNIIFISFNFAFLILFINNTDFSVNGAKLFLKGIIYFVVIYLVVKCNILLDTTNISRWFYKSHKNEILKKKN